MLSLHKKFYIKDENDRKIYEISSKLFSFGDKITINDEYGNKVVYIKQELFHITPNYNVYINDKYMFKIIKKFQIFKNDYLLSNGYRVDGNLRMFDFHIYDADKKIGSIKRKLLSIGDQYEIIIDDESKKEIVLSIIVAISNDIVRIRNNS